MFCVLHRKSVFYKTSSVYKFVSSFGDTSSLVGVISDLLMQLFWIFDLSNLRNILLELDTLHSFTILDIKSDHTVHSYRCYGDNVINSAWKKQPMAIQ